MQYLLANGERMRIREAVPEDASALLDMFKSVVNETDFLMTTPEESGQMTIAYEKDFIERYWKMPNNLFLIAVTEDKVLASLIFTQNRSQRQSHVGELGVVVLTAYWNMGIARRMINHFMKWVSAHPLIRYVQLSVMANNEKAIRLYRKFGFREEGRRPRAVYLSHSMYSDVILMGQWVDKTH